MSGMSTLQELTLDAARYRWLRENFPLLLNDLTVREDYDFYIRSPESRELDTMIDGELARE